MYAIHLIDCISVVFSDDTDAAVKLSDTSHRSRARLGSD
jgi:hypothetical protein